MKFIVEIPDPEIYPLSAAQIEAARREILEALDDDINVISIKVTVMLDGGAAETADFTRALVLVAMHQDIMRLTAALRDAADHLALAHISNRSDHCEVWAREAREALLSNLSGGAA